MSWTIGLVLTYAGLSTLAMSLRKHRDAVFGRSTTGRSERALRALGACLLLASTLWCVERYGWGLGLVVLCAILTVAGLAVTLVLTYRPADFGGALGAAVALGVLVSVLA